MSWPGQRWTPGDMGTTGPLFSRSDGSGGAETLRRMMETQRRRSSAGGGDGGGISALAAFGAVGGGPSAAVPPTVTVTAQTGGVATVAVETETQTLPVEHVAVTVNDGPPIWVPTIAGIGATQMIVETGDEITATGATDIKIVGEE